MPVPFPSLHPTPAHTDADAAASADSVIQGDRLTLENRMDSANHAAAAAGQDVITGLTQPHKALPPKYFYDAHGSELFEQITELPEYYLTRTERQILATDAGAIADIVGPCDLIELGSGSASKTRLLFNAYQQRGLPLRYVPVDVSGTMLETSAQALLTEYDQLTVHGLVSTYDQALQNLPPTDYPRRLIAFIGSTLGNLAPAPEQRFFQQVSQALASGDYFLLGVDLHKDTATLEAAYNDQQGISAAFNLNMLKHLNWRFDGNFDLTQFRHVAFYNEGDRQVEMYIESLTAQTITLQALNLTVEFAQGERLFSEISRKFDTEVLTQELLAFDLAVRHIFTDDQRQFALLLCQKQSSDAP
ncbi:L-histidine N(alpha)-methyltransferase [Halomicronema sp. CCY15110]|uniref:L-histidine N(alpha)-methyltransferase n=1 Tax=Halomicronema sp. CCY15110 TaxID=2767773 RepID=UPI00194E4C3D|nr:L-histidine N(alpha)-methyltransferase [Halomicronema sp. CCY15110]